MGWVFAAVVILAYAGTALWSLRTRRAAGLADTDAAGPIARIVIVAAATIAIVAVLNSDRGVPLAVLILVAFVAGMQYVAARTLFGRHVFAVGGSAEAARRAGIRTRRIRIIVFGISGTMAAIGGVLAASRLLAVDQSSGGSDLLLFAIAGPVIAGTSLFGGRGSVWSALLGAITIGSISNGMDLLALQSSVKFMVTGGVLVLAVIVDALARRNRQARA
jgi:D-xylose transport system permease protein